MMPFPGNKMHANNLVSHYRHYQQLYVTKTNYTYNYTYTNCLHLTLYAKHIMLYYVTQKNKISASI